MRRAASSVPAQAHGAILSLSGLAIFCLCGAAASSVIVAEAGTPLIAAAITTGGSSFQVRSPGVLRPLRWSATGAIPTPWITLRT